MPLFESESLVLRTFNLSEADKIVVFFTRDHGIVRGVAKGAKRLKSRYGSSLEPFSTVNLTYFQKDDRELVSIQTVDLVSSCFDAAGDPDFLKTFSYVAELLIAIVPPHDPNEIIYRMTKACLSVELSDQSRLSAVRLYFELWLLRLGGYLPDWSICSSCSRVLTVSEPASLLHDLHLVCDECRRSRRLPSVSTVQREIFHSVRQLAPPDFVELAAGHSETIRELSGLLGRIIVQVVGREVTTGRSLALAT